MHLALFLANVQDLWGGCRGFALLPYLQLPALLIFADHCFSCGTISAFACSVDLCGSLLQLLFLPHSAPSLSHPGSWARVAIGLSTILLKTMGYLHGANSPWWDENRNRGKDKSNRKLR